MGKVKVTQVRSTIGRTAHQKKTLQALGLRKMHQSVIQEDNAVIQGMIAQVRHLVNVEEA